MDSYYFTFHSMTQAQSASAVLQRHGMMNVFMRAPKAISMTGCGYAVQVTLPEIYGAIHALRSAGIFPKKVMRHTDSGDYREVFL